MDTIKTYYYGTNMGVSITLLSLIEIGKISENTANEFIQEYKTEEGMEDLENIYNEVKKKFKVKIQKVHKEKE